MRGAFGFQKTDKGISAMSEKDSDKNKIDDDLDREIVYYYSRERRLSRAPQRVRDMNDPNSGKPGFVARIVGNRGNLLIMVSILMVFVMTMLQSKNRAPEGFELAGNYYKLSIEKNESGQLRLDIVKTKAENSLSYDGDVVFIISPVQRLLRDGKENPPAELYEETINFGIAEEETKSIILPPTFEGSEYLVVMGIGEEMLPPKVINVRR